jgi:hypothetical protein
MYLHTRICVCGAVWVGREGGSEPVGGGVSGAPLVRGAMRRVTVGGMAIHMLV